ncbi:hypothetical protein [Metabacillus sp. 84]|uniref:hypothetical protein n=1 Tax=Metabacillus sp. 84 TaxID=3404705 RepID=UPI003CEBE212
MKLLRLFFSFLLLISLLTFPASATGGPFENLGPQVKYVNVIRGKAGLDQYGQPRFYALLQGEPAKLAVIDLQTEKIVDIETLPGASAAWSIEIDPQHRVWVGSTPNEHLYRYDPETKEITDLGKATTTSNTTIWDLTYDKKSNRIFGVTSYGGSVITYSEEEGFKSLGGVMKGRRYARSVEYDEKTNTLYVGVGSPAALIKWDLDTNQKTNILPEKYQKDASVYDLNLSRGRVYAKMENQSMLLVINTKNDQVEHEIPADSRGISQAWDGDTVFYSYKKKLYELNPKDGKSKEVNSDLPATAASLDIISIDGQPKLVGLSANGGKFYQYHLKEDKYKDTMLNLPSQAVDIYNVGQGVNGNIYSSGFISGKLGVYNPESKETKMYKGVGQVEDMASVGKKMYFGVYPNAILYEYDTAKNWVPGENPKRIINLGDSGQDRPKALAGDEEKERLYAGTIPKRGEKTGMFLVYDVNKRKISYKEKLSYNQSASAMVYSEQKDILYFATSAYDGSGNLSNKSAQLYAVDTNSPKYRKKVIQLPGGYAVKISALTITPDGRLWGIVDNKLLVYDPEKEKPSLYPITPNQIKGMYKTESLLLDPSGKNLYGTFQGMLFKVDIESLEITSYRTSDVFQLANDSQGNLYYNSRSNLWKIRPEDLTKDHILTPGELTLPNVSSTNSSFPVARVYSEHTILLYRKKGSTMVPVKQLKADSSYRVYGTYKNYYHIGNDYYIYNEPHKVSAYVGRVYAMGEAAILKPDGSVYRTLKPGENMKVYSYDDQSYDVGEGYKIQKNGAVTFSIGTVELNSNSMMFQYGENLPIFKLQAGEKFEIVKTEGNKLILGNGYYLEYNKRTMTYKKN